MKSSTVCILQFLFNDLLPTFMVVAITIRAKATIVVISIAIFSFMHIVGRAQRHKIVFVFLCASVHAIA